MDRNFLWSSILAEMELSLSPGNFATWVAPMKSASLEKNALDHTLTLSCPSVFHKNQVSERYVGQIQKLAEKNLKTKCEVVLTIEQREAADKSGVENDLFSIDVVKMADEAYL
ncbi:hypothetical protein L6272_03635, partial [Microgenomates group bacterium]|nr:hypothetical protein [Microgenomates group bacterium]